MAGDYLIWTKNLDEKAETLRIAEACGISGLLAAGRLMKFWEWAEEQTETGFIPALSVRTLSHLLSHLCPEAPLAFFSTLCAVGWMSESSEGITIPNFERWMGKGAKRRLKESLRKRQYRQGPPGGAHGVPDLSRNGADRSMPEPAPQQQKQKQVSSPPNPPPGGRRPKSEKADPPKTADGFARFWAAYPRKEARGAAERAWDKLAPDDELVERLLADLAAQQQWREVWPRANTWLRNHGWEDAQPAAGKSRFDRILDERTRDA